MYRAFFRGIGGARFGIRAVVLIGCFGYPGADRIWRGVVLAFSRNFSGDPVHAVHYSIVPVSPVAWNACHGSQESPRISPVFSGIIHVRLNI